MSEATGADLVQQTIAEALLGIVPTLDTGGLVFPTLDEARNILQLLPDDDTKEGVPDDVDSDDVPDQKTPRRRLNYTLEFKNKVILYAEKTNNCQAATKYKVPRQCIQRWRQIKPELEEQMLGTPHSSKKKRLGGGGRPLKNVELDEKLEAWLKEKLHQKGVKVTGKMIKEYAISICGNDTFKASNGWLQRFMIRHGLAAPPAPKDSPSEHQPPPSPSPPPPEEDVDEEEEKPIPDLFNVIRGNGWDEMWNGVARNDDDVEEDGESEADEEGAEKESEDSDDDEEDDEEEEEEEEVVKEKKETVRGELDKFLQTFAIETHGPSTSGVEALLAQINGSTPVAQSSSSATTNGTKRKGAELDGREKKKRKD